MAKKLRDCIIIGGGAAGLAAAVQIKHLAPDCDVLILEKNPILGKKLRATGNGRCNLTNRAIPTVQDTVDFFEQILGIPIIFDAQGRGYPFSESAAVVVDTFETYIRSHDVEIETEAVVNEIEPLKDGDFLVKTAAKKYRTHHVILAAGGKAAPQFGSTGDGYTIAKALGHTVNKTIPVLTPIICADMPNSLNGVRVKGRLSLTFENREARDKGRGTEAEKTKTDSVLVFEEFGEIQLTEYGISGICAFNLSRHLKYRDERKLTPYHIHIDCDPDHQTDDWLVKSDKPDQRLFSIFKTPLAEEILRRAGQNASSNAIITLLHDLTFNPIDVKGFKNAQCTSGGIPLDEIDSKTMMSKKFPGLYFAGEILDYDGPCGGFNLDHAFRSGCATAIAIMRNA